MIAASVQLSGFPSRPSKASVEVSVPDGATINDLVIALRDQHPEVPELRQLRPDQLVIAVDDQTIKGLDKPLVADGATRARVKVLMVRLLAGG
jgi:molybdopterin converting factor small subunit